MSSKRTKLSVDLTLREEFFYEAHSLLSKLDSITKRLKTSICTDECLYEAFRVIHNVKGGAMALGMDKLSSLGHETESNILKYKNIDQISRVLNKFKLDAEIIIKDIKKYSNKIIPSHRNLNIIFSKLERVVATTSKVLGKKIELNIDCIDIVLANHKIALIESSLMHILRNACDHGIEDNEVREHYNKKPIGSISVSIFKENELLIIEVTDDGTGIDFQNIISKAKGAGLEIHNLSSKILFSPYFTTKVESSSISGRGIGLDIVKTNIESLGGDIDVRSSKGEGTTFKMILPLSNNAIAA
jgi:chemotaxis protein histidine kinase CheA